MRAGITASGGVEGGYSIQPVDRWSMQDARPQNRRLADDSSLQKEIMPAVLPRKNKRAAGSMVWLPTMPLGLGGAR